VREWNRVGPRRFLGDEPGQLPPRGMAVHQIGDDAEPEIRDRLLLVLLFVSCHRKPPECGFRKNLAPPARSGESPGYVKWSSPSFCNGIGGWKTGRRRPRSRRVRERRGSPRAGQQPAFPQSGLPQRPRRRAPCRRAWQRCPSRILPTNSAHSARSFVRSA